MWPDFEEDVWGAGVGTSAAWRDDVTSPLTAASTPNEPPNTASPPIPESPLQDIIDDPDFDRISDQDDIVEGEAVWRGEPAAVRRHAMAADFEREGQLEIRVDSPQKENVGQQTQYISYLCTTKSNFASFQKGEFSVRISSCRAHEINAD